MKTLQTSEARAIIAAAQVALGDILTLTCENAHTLAADTCKPWGECLDVCTLADYLDSRGEPYTDPFTAGIYGASFDDVADSMLEHVADLLASGAPVMESDPDTSADLLQGCRAAIAYLADPPSKFPENRAAAVQIIRSAISKAERSAK